MRGTNPKRPPAKGDGSTLEVKEIFHTFQGEGPYVGRPATFIRLAGCNLACTFCDTDFDNGLFMSLDHILGRLSEPEGRKRNLAVITGGEPLRQAIGPLCSLLIDKGWTVQIETNGTLWRPLPKAAEAVCSPKYAGDRYAKPDPRLTPHIKAFKFLISAEDSPYRHVPDFVDNYPDIPVYVQPIDTGDVQQNAANTRRTIEVAEQGGRHISLQMHKILGVA